MKKSLVLAALLSLAAACSPAIGTAQGSLGPADYGFELPSTRMLSEADTESRRLPYICTGIKSGRWVSYRSTTIYC